MIKRRDRTSKLGKQLLFRIIIALLGAALVFLFVFYAGQFLNKESSVVEDIYESPLLDEVVMQLQEYIIANQLASYDYPMLRLWLRRNHGIGLIYSDAISMHTNYTLTFSDKKIEIYPYVVMDQYTKFIGMVAAILSCLTSLLVLIPYVKKLVNDITQLSSDMNILASGNLEHKVSLSRHDELAILAQSINEMRISVSEQLKKESAAIKSNQELVTSLSHDLRTPLTKAIGYLEIIQHESDELPEKQQEYISRISKAIIQVKDRSDQLLKYSMDSMQPKDQHVQLDGSKMLRQLFSDFTQYLESQGFIVDLQQDTPPFDMSIHPIDIERIFDNLASNIVKYADSQDPVTVRSVLNSGRIIIEIKNTIKLVLQENDGDGIGLITSKKLALRNNGFLHYYVHDQSFIAVLKLQIEEGECDKSEVSLHD